MRVSLIPLLLVQTLSLFFECRSDSEVYGTYNLIDGLKSNYALQSNPTATEQPSQASQPSQLQTDPSQSTPHDSTAKNENEDQSKQVSPPNFETTTEVPISAYQSQQLAQSLQSPVNRLQAVKYNPLMARNIGLSSLMLSGVLYGLTVLPAIIAITGVSPLSSKSFNNRLTRGSNSKSQTSGLFGSLGRRKRSLVNESHIFRQLPLLTNEETFKFLKLFESTLAVSELTTDYWERNPRSALSLSIGPEDREQSMQEVLHVQSVPSRAEEWRET